MQRLAVPSLLLPKTNFPLLLIQQRTKLPPDEQELCLRVMTSSNKMDADALRMLADLGLERRDIVSAPDADSKGRACHEDPRQKAALVARFEARRVEREDDTASGGDQKAAERAGQLKAWNSESTVMNHKNSTDLPQPIQTLRKTKWPGSSRTAGAVKAIVLLLRQNS